MIRKAYYACTKRFEHDCRWRIPLAFMLLFWSGYLTVYADIIEDSDTTLVDLSEFELSDVATSSPRVLRYTPLDNRIVLSLAADSLPVVKDFPRWAKIFLNSWTQAAEDRTRVRPVDFNFAVAPSYSREASFGIGGSVTALFRVNRNDTLPQPSFCFASVNASLNGFYTLKSRGSIFFPDNRSRISYTLDVSRKRLYFWGINIFETSNNPRSKYTRSQIALSLRFDYRIAGDLFLGAEVFADYTNGRRFTAPEYLLDEKRDIYATGLGCNISYDTRDVATEPYRGIYASYRPLFYPKGLNTAGSWFQSHRFDFNSYHNVWNGGVIATDIYARFTSRKTPWTLREMAASDGIRLRGYYMGTYIDHNQIAAQVELRQHVWDRLGVVAWGGMSTMFSHIGHKSEPIRQVWLPNAGFGLRLNFRPRVNGRIDFGFGRHNFGVMVALGEAF